MERHYRPPRRPWRATNNNNDDDDGDDCVPACPPADRAFALEALTPAIDATLAPSWPIFREALLVGRKVLTLRRGTTNHKIGTTGAATSKYLSP